MSKLIDEGATAKVYRNDHASEGEVKNELLTLRSQLDDKSEKLCHGDFHPLNVLYDGHKHSMIDWVDAIAGNPLVMLVGQSVWNHLYLCEVGVENV